MMSEFGMVSYLQQQQLQKLHKIEGNDTLISISFLHLSGDIICSSTAKEYSHIHNGKSTLHK